MGIEVAGAGWYVPEEILDNQFFIDRNPWFTYDVDFNRVRDPATPSGYKETFMTNDDIVALCGVERRHRARPDEFIHDMMAEAALRALDDANMNASELGFARGGTVTQQRKYPGAGQMVQRLLGAQNAQITPDTLYACAAFPLVMMDTALWVQATGRPGLVVVGDTLTKVVDYEGTLEIADGPCGPLMIKNKHAILFGDGAAAVILVPSASRDKGIAAFAGRSDPFGDNYRFINHDPRYQLNMSFGKDVLDGAIAGMSGIARELMGALEITVDDVDFFNFHQLNMRALRGKEKLYRLGKIGGLRGELGIPEEKMGINIMDYGNMSPASCGIQYVQALKDKRVGPGSLELTIAAGAGMVFGGIAQRH